MTSSSNPQSEIPNPQLLRLFVYGTLKRGFWNHDRFCRGVLTVEDAVVRGRLFETPSSIPVLEVPEEDILAIDRLEGFHPLSACGHAQAGGGPYLYCRVLVPIRTNGTVLPAWLYVADVTEYLGFKPLPSGKWRS